MKLRIGPHQLVIDEIDHLHAGEGRRHVQRRHLLRNIEDAPAVEQAALRAAAASKVVARVIGFGRLLTFARS